MGVPKFYRWVSERYPCLSEAVKEHQIPEFDNLYLDMNGIIHQCSHPNDEDIHFRIADDKIFADIFHYLEVLFRIIRPRKVFFMAVDGVAPRAKMNQQRGRRFRSAKEAEDKIKKAIEKGEVLPAEARFDSNCITPGTAFMDRLHEHLKYFVNKKISTDKSWQRVCVYFSGHETPGEGEHKIMEFIRSEKAKTDYNPDTRHCLYGLDADLIMLGLTSHETHFSLLREEVRFGGKKNQKRTFAPEETTFHLLHLSLMRQYIDYEFSSLRDNISFTYDVERIIDDWILMGFLVGNDFIPHLPHLHINHDALPLLYKTYIGILPQLGGYINENGHLNLMRFQKYLAQLANFDREQFNEVFVDLKWFESKIGNKYLNEAAGKAAEESRRCKNQKLKAYEDLFLAALDKTEDQPNSSKTLQEEDVEDDDLFETEFRQYKRSYYMTKMGVEVVSDEFLEDQARCYVMAIQWILHYYYHGVQSWSWYYPYHYAPYLSDIQNICKFKLQFELGKPFLPFEQLLAVLPAFSRDLLPISYQNLMISEDSPIIEYYPTNFKTDLNGKQQEWEAVVLIPFIDEERLLLAMEPGNKSLSEEEKRRNQHSECLKYWYDSDMDFSYLSPWPEKFPSVNRCQARCKTILMDAWHVDIIHNKLTNAHVGPLYFHGFPSLLHIKHKFYLKKNGVQVFQQSSRCESMILEILSDDNPDECQSIEHVASEVLGKSVFVNWPHLEEARVIAVSDGEIKFYLEELPGNQKLYVGNSAPPTKVACIGEKEQNIWVKEVQGIVEHYQRRKGIIINETSILLYAQLLTGRRYFFHENGQVILEKQWSKQVLPFALQVVVPYLRAFNFVSVMFKSLDDLFSPQTLVFMLGIPYYGCMGEVEDSSDVIGESRIRVLFSIPCEPTFDALIQNQHKYSIKYNPGYLLANRLGVSGYVVSRFTGSIFIGRGSKRNTHGECKTNVGLNLKFNKKNEEVPGYTKKIGNEWLYSSAVELLLGEYLERFPELFRYVSKNSQDDVFYEDDVWPEEDENGAERVQEISAWLKSHPVSNLSRSSCDLQILDTAVVEKIEEEIDKCKIRKNKQKVRVTVKPHLLFRPLEQHRGVVPDRDVEYRLFDRVVNVRDGFSVPTGLRGTVIGIKGAERETDVLYEVIFDEEFPGGLSIRCSQARCYRLPAYALINLTHGIRTECGGQKLTAIVKPQPTPNHYIPYSNSCMENMKKKRLGGINHSPCSPFIPTRDKHDDEFCNVWQSLQDNGKSLQAHQHVQDKFIMFPSEKKLASGAQFHKPCYSECSPKSRTKKTEHLKNLKEESKFPKNENQTQKMSEKHDLSYVPKPNVRLLKRNENLISESQEGLCLASTTEKDCTEFENIISSLKISDENEVKCPQSKDDLSSEEDHLSPQSFALKGTLMLKEILKIDGSETVERPRQSKPLVVDGGKRDSHVPFSQRRQTKKMAAHMGKPQVLSGMQSFQSIGQPFVTQKPVTVTPVLELSRICSLVGMLKPEFSFLRLTQAMTVCQVSLSNGLFIHGPQCPSENEAMEKAALFALHRLSSFGMNCPVSPLIQNVQAMGGVLPPGTIKHSFPQSAASIMSPPPQIFGTVPLQSPVHRFRKTFSPGSYPANVPPSVPVPVGAYNPFIPLQATRKKADRKKDFEFNKLKIASQTSSPKNNQPEVLDAARQAVSDTTATPIKSPLVEMHSTSSQDTAQPQSADVARSKSRLSSSKRKPRKLAVNFHGTKPVE